MLYLIPTPIGNIRDITLRALDILKEADLILCEDTRVSGKLLKHYEIEKKLFSFHAHNEHYALDKWIDEMKAGKTIGLISDAGTPGISDPGFLLVRACRSAEIPVSCLPGATAFVPALVSSGLPCDKFYFEGFLPQKKGRMTRWLALKYMNTTLVLYESPHRIVKCLEQIIEYFGPEVKVSVSREISKMYEECLTLSAQALHENLKSRASIKGEFVVVIDNNIKKKSS